MDASWTCVGTCVGWPNGLASFLANTSRKKKKHFKADYPLFHWLIIGWWTLLNLRCLVLGGQTVRNLRRLACKFDLDQSERKSSQVNACMQGLAKWSRKLTQVFNLRLLETPFGQGLKGTEKFLLWTLRLNTLRGNRTAFLTPERYDEHPIHFYMRVIPGLNTV